MPMIYVNDTIFKELEKIRKKLSLNFKAKVSYGDVIRHLVKREKMRR